jgi:hypothetical protein
MLGAPKNLHIPQSFLTISYLFAFVLTQMTASPFPPSAVPLAVVHPYFSTWLSNGNNSLSGTWPQFSTQGVSSRCAPNHAETDGGMQYITGWAGYVRVDGQAYRFLGADPIGESANQTSLTWTATQSTFEFVAGPVTVTANFLTPIEVQPRLGSLWGRAPRLTRTE